MQLLSKIIQCIMMTDLANKIINLIKSCLKLKTKLSTYTAGTVRANQKLKELAEYLKTVDRPTILVVLVIIYPFTRSL